jgi:uncharacterized RDD family membrane protein YckC
MPYCPNPDCPHRQRLDEAAEFNPGIKICSDCGSALSEIAPHFQSIQTSKKVPKASSVTGRWTCPECGSVNSNEISLCTCGYDSNRPYVMTDKLFTRPAVDAAVQDERPKYAGFWPRFGALLLDFVVFSPIMGLTLYLSYNFRLFNLYYFIPGLFISFMYSIYLVRRYGGTPGKLLMGLRITRLDFSPISYREAILRDAPDFILGAIASFAIIIASLKMTDAEYLSLSTTVQFKTLQDHTPPWYKVIGVIQNIWIWGEFIVLLTNRKRRALHDFIAGTVVIKKPRTKVHSTSTA